MIRRAWAAIPFVLAWAIGHSAAIAAPTFADQVESFFLDNGLQVVVIPDHRAPIVTHMIWYKVGAADEPPGKSGIAHFLEHLMFKGTENHPDGEFSEMINSVGGRENAFTSADATVYHQTVAKQHLELMMAFEADRMANLVLTDEEVATERGVILEEWRTRTDNEPSSQLSEAIGSTLFQNSGYGIPIIGWAHEMATLDREDALAFYDRFYTPSNAIVIVAGDVMPDEVRTLAEGTYGQVAQRAEPERFRPREPEPLAARTVTHEDPRVTQPMVQRVYLAPSYATAEPGEAVALDILADILGSGPTSRLYGDLVIDDGIATAASVYYRANAFGDTIFWVFGIPRGDVDLDTLMAEIQATIADIAANGVTDEELERAKHRVRAAAIFAQDSHASLARVFGTALVAGQTIEDVQAWPAEVEMVTSDEIAAVARKYLIPERSVTGYLIGSTEEGRS
ncbi:M16 family metallopeptidase [Bauldia sp.]|uniref:M16 family metallopeptidase n=1 Tax=Bauldia sp. TaxID=2575872 RepID=UPI003BAB077D